MKLFWHPEDGGADLETGGTCDAYFHLAEAHGERGLCGASIRGRNAEPSPPERNTCSRCWVLADIAGQKVPQQFSRAKSQDTEGQGSLL